MSREAGLFEVLTATDRLSDLLPALHHHAVSALSGRGSILFQFSRSGDCLHATSAFGLDHLPNQPWPGRTLPEGVFQNGTPVFVNDVSRLVPIVSGILETSSAVLVPLAHMHDPLGVLLIGCDSPPSDGGLRDAAAVGHAFVFALERARAAGEVDLQRQLAVLLQAFTREVSNTTLATGLEAVCGGANRLFGADRTAVWLHDRHARALALSASSDATEVAQERRVPTSDPFAPAALGLRSDGAEIRTMGTTPGGSAVATVTIPLKGQRRALGTVVMEDVRIEPGARRDRVERADELGRQLSGAIENVLLLDVVLRSRRELENTFNSLADLVAVSDEQGRLVYMNHAFLERIGRPRRELIDRPLLDIVGEPTKALIAERRGQTPMTRSFEVEDDRLGGTFHITLTPLVDDDRKPMGLVLVARDISAHARLEA